ncbi:preprotein translocase, SecY subunit [Desulfosporosinus orientis DSM 765]|uniref:Protein translocase subunit SecY n=1 Tax=Desulfosporosinus orientis (strain ATCC 19365 / DSM 765 / NCIMB 8382 / VKM B-1628 / Singapore I) TaxID=768706 RepID=G7W9Y7_DESOD|nr:preprotein translocase subunit SecY [Desulfosporosinus orientis]AET65983.1 preprotein translocase, SecY subunit [Desulfosporosinus orientis DSM 765]
MAVDSLKNAWNVGELRKKIGYTLLMFLIFRIGAHIPTPYIDRDTLNQMLGSGAIMNFMNTISGGSFKSLSVFALSITPYITASIILQLLTIVIPSLERLSKEGDFGRKKITQYTRYSTVGLGFFQAFGLTYGIRAAVLVPTPAMKWPTYLLIAIVLTAGTSFLMWLGEAITEKGIGNGISLIIFAGIVSRIPTAMTSLWDMLRVGEINSLTIIGLVLIVIFVTAGVIYVQEGQRRVTVQYAKRVVGRRVYGGQSSHIPLKVNQAGVIPVIFAISLLAFPQTIASWMPTSAFAQFVSKWFSMNGSITSIPYMLVYGALIIFFTYFYTAITFNPVDVADNLKKYGGFIPGLRPGRPTAEYLTKVLNRITLAGGIFLALIAVLPTLVIGVTGLKNIYFGGTSLLIVVGVALDTMKQIESQLMSRHYQGFMR